MIPDKVKFNTIDEYIRTFPPDIQKTLGKIRETIKKTAPSAEESISYQIPTFKLNGNLVHFAAFKNHIGFYPGAKAIEVFKEDLSRYNTSKGAVQFPFEQPIPLDLISKIVKYTVKFNLEKMEAKKRKEKKNG